MEEKQELADEKSTIWYFRPWAIVVAIIAFGPLGLLLLWFRPNTKIYIKLLITAVVIALTGWMASEFTKFYQTMIKYYGNLP